MQNRNISLYRTNKVIKLYIQIRLTKPMIIINVSMISY